MRKSFKYGVEVVETECSELESVLVEYDKNGYYVREMKPKYVANTLLGIEMHFVKKV